MTMAEQIGFMRRPTLAHNGSIDPEMRARNESMGINPYTRFTHEDIVELIERAKILATEPRAKWNTRRW